MREQQSSSQSDDGEVFMPGLSASSRLPSIAHVLSCLELYQRRAARSPVHNILTSSRQEEIRANAKVLIGRKNHATTG